MIRISVFATLFVVALTVPSMAQDHRVAKADAPVPADAIAPEIAGLIAPGGLKVTKGDSRLICELWLAKEWPVAADAKVGGEVLYPLTPGQIVGVVRFPRKASDFREQDIPAGTYIARYAQQPVDGAHVGTSPTRDFLALLPAAKDRDPKAIDFKTLTAISKETTGTAHPAILSLQKAEGSEPLSIREDSDRQWVILHFVGKISGGKELPMELVVIGKAAE